MLLICAVAAALGAAALGALACEGAPARPRPWRHARPNVAPEAEPQGGSVEAIARQKQEAARKRVVSLRIRLEAEPAHLHPLLDADLDALHVVEDTVFETLLRVVPGDAADGPGTLVPGLAESWRVIGGGTEIRLTLRDDVQFHDGSRFTVVDAQYSLDAARSPRSRAVWLRDAMADVITVELVGPRELRLLLRRPNAYVLRALALAPMLPEKVYRGTDERATRTRTPVGTGPFRFVRWDKKEKIALARNETYWGKPPAFEALDFVIEPDGARALTRAKRGEIDVIPALAAVHLPEQIGAMAPEFELLELRPARMTYVVLNAARAPFDDARVRRAVAMLVDRGRLASEIHHGLWRPVAGPVWPGGPGDGAMPPVSAFDPAAAAALLDQSGWILSASGSARERAGQRMRVAVLVENGERADPERDLVVGALRRAGFVVEVRPGDPAVLMNRLRDGEFDAALLDWRAHADEDLWPLLGTGGVRNWGRYSSKAMDAALEAVRAAWEPGGRATRLAEVARLCAEDMPVVALVAPRPRGLVHRRVRHLRVRDGWFAIRDVELTP